MRRLALTLAVLALLLAPSAASASRVYTDVNGNATGAGAVDGISTPLAPFRRIVLITYQADSYTVHCRGRVVVTIRAFTPAAQPTRHPVPFETARVVCARRAWRTSVALVGVPADDPITVSEAKR